jgi:hypothetical protein
MDSAALVWLSGLSLAVGGLLATLGWILFVILDPNHERYAGRSWIVLNFLIIFGGVFMAMGLPGFYATQADQAGVIGLLGFVVFFVGIVIPHVAVHSIETVTSPNIPPGMRTLVSIGAPSLFLGALLTGIATYSAAAYPAWLSIGLVVPLLPGLFAQLKPVAAVFTRGVFPALFTGMMTVIGMSVLLSAG